ncbi:hypothetical protein OG252_48905 [Streptomyces sp. NBC_01352]|uniref:hypothetical protein n=1 Tax=Streptomyces sp. NBC_01352 TaxID=2903834 RepID=UPI002E36FE6B|nr:hypothetical protein [Streptomyces sp. NBC_01352]
MSTIVRLTPPISPAAPVIRMGLPSDIKVSVLCLVVVVVVGWWWWESAVEKAQEVVGDGLGPLGVH